MLKYPIFLQDNENSCGAYCIKMLLSFYKRDDEIKNIKNARAFRDSLAEAVENERLRMKVRQGEVYDPQSIAGPDDDFDDGF